MIATAKSKIERAQSIAGSSVPLNVIRGVVYRVLRAGDLIKAAVIEDTPSGIVHGYFGHGAFDNKSNAYPLIVELIFYAPGATTNHGWAGLTPRQAVTFVRSAPVEQVDWRPQETLPEDYYALNPDQDLRQLERAAREGDLQALEAISREARRRDDQRLLLLVVRIAEGIWGEVSTRIYQSGGPRTVQEGELFGKIYEIWGPAKAQLLAE